MQVVMLFIRLKFHFLRNLVQTEYKTIYKTDPYTNEMFGSTSPWNVLQNGRILMTMSKCKFENWKIWFDFDVRPFAVVQRNKKE